MPGLNLKKLCNVTPLTLSAATPVGGYLDHLLSRASAELLQEGGLSSASPTCNQNIAATQPTPGFAHLIGDDYWLVG
jgi:hypothetical protein